MLKRKVEDEKARKLDALRELAEAYWQADKRLERACGDEFDPIACTVYALKKHRVDELPAESVPAAKALEACVSIHRELVWDYGMDIDAVRAIWLPILNRVH
jgi:hypothetical protein